MNVRALHLRGKGSLAADGRAKGCSCARRTRGIRDHDGHICFSPRLPEEISRLAFSLALGGGTLRVEVDTASASYDRVDGGPLEVAHHGDRFTVSTGAPVVRTIPRLVPRPRPPQPQGREPGAIGRPGP